MKKVFILIAVLLIIIAGAYFLFSKENKKVQEREEGQLPQNMKAVIKTNLGDIELELFSSLAPKTVDNFKKLSKEGFYDGVKFHRVIKDFMIQGGGPLTKQEELKGDWGTGNPGYFFEDEIHKENRNSEGAISMANTGRPNTNGCQFFINTNNNNYLDKKHTVFGKVIKGMDVVEKIENLAADENGLPLDPAVIQTIEIYD